MNIADIPGVGSLPVLLAYHINLLSDRHEAAWRRAADLGSKTSLRSRPSRGGPSCCGSCWLPSWPPAGNVARRPTARSIATVSPVTPR